VPVRPPFRPPPHPLPVLPLMILLFLFGIVSAAIPSALICVSQTGLQNAATFGSATLVASLASVHTPPWHATTHAGILGKVDVDGTLLLERGAITTVAIAAVGGVDTMGRKTAELRLVFPASLAVTAASNISWEHKHFPHASGHDHAVASTAEATAQATIQLAVGGSSAAPGGPEPLNLGVSAANVSCSIPDLSVHVTGSLSWLINLITSLFRGKLKQTTADALAGAMTKGVDVSLNHAISRVPATANLTTDISLNYSLVANPYVDPASGGLALPLDGTAAFANGSGSCGAPCTPSLPTPALNTTKDHLQVLLSSAVLNSISFAYWQDNKMQVNLTQANIPSWLNLTLDTTYFGALVPQLLTKFGPGKPVQLYLYVPSTAPTATFSANANAAIAHALGYLNVSVAGTPAFTLALDVTASLALTLSPNATLVTGKLAARAPTVTLVSSAVGNFNPLIFSSFLSVLVTDVVVPTANLWLTYHGVPLPAVSPNIAFVDTFLTFLDDYLLIGTNVTFLQD